MTVTVAAFVQEGEPPEAVGRVGAVRSILAVLAGPAVPGTHALVLPAPSTERNWVMVAPSPVTAFAGPEDGDDQAAPPLVDVRYS